MTKLKLLQIKFGILSLTANFVSELVKISTPFFHDVVTDIVYVLHVCLEKQAFIDTDKQVTRMIYYFFGVTSVNSFCFRESSKGEARSRSYSCLLTLALPPALSS